MTENGFVQINIPQILDMQSLTLDILSYCRQVYLLEFWWLSILCLNSVCYMPFPLLQTKLFADWKTINI